MRPKAASPKDKAILPRHGASGQPAHAAPSGPRKRAVSHRARNDRKVSSIPTLRRTRTNPPSTALASKVYHGTAKGSYGQGHPTKVSGNCQASVCTPTGGRRTRKPSATARLASSSPIKPSLDEATTNRKRAVNPPSMADLQLRVCIRKLYPPALRAPW